MRTSVHTATDLEERVNSIVIVVFILRRERAWNDFSRALMCFDSEIEVRYIEEEEGRQVGRVGYTVSDHGSGPSQGYYSTRLSSRSPEGEL